MFTKTITGLAVAAAILAGAGPAAAKDVTIRYSNWLPPGFFLWDEVIHPYLDEIEKVTDGRVKVDVLPKVVGSVVGQYDVVSQGLADMSFIVLGYTPGRFAPTEFAELPLIPGDTNALGKAYYKIYEDHLAGMNLFPEVQLMTITPLSPLQVETRKVMVASVADMNGKKFRTSTTTLTEALELMGAVPIHKSSTEAFEMLSTGTIDGQVTQLNTIVGFNGLDLHDHVLLMKGGISNSVDVIAMNPDKWAEISEADQKAIMAISGAALADQISKAYQKADEDSLKIMKDAGYVITEASPEVSAGFAKVLAPLEDDWIKRAKAAGMANPEEVLAAYRAAVGAGN